jgi:aminopeptidase
VTPDRLKRYADLIVRVGANVAPGQDVQINSIVDNAPLVRAVARSAYEEGAR